MKALNDYEFLGSYCKLDHDIAHEFYMPCMSNSVRYDRLSGYFSSTIYLIAWDALKDFIENGGKIRVMCSPYLSDADAQAISKGMNARSNAVIRDALMKDIQSMMVQEDLSRPSHLLMCLIAEGIIEVRILVARSGTNPDVLKLYHDKAGVFYDQYDNAVGFRGSFNETFKGLSNDGNVESIDVFQSWDGGKDGQRVKLIGDIFNGLWDRKYANVDVYSLPEEVSDFIQKDAKDYNWQKLLEEITITKSKEKKWNPTHGKSTLRLRDHQINALEGWEKQGYRAVYQGCTGCGKTLIAISAIRKMLDAGKTVLVLAPSVILQEHWHREIIHWISDMELQFMMCGNGHNEWKQTGALYTFSGSSASLHKIIIAVMDTASSNAFIGRLHGGDHLFVVADEVHRMGSASRRRFFAVKSGPRLGVSATPQRYGDPEGTQAIIDYFGAILQPPYTLKNALDDHVLSEYFYHPVAVELTEVEQHEWDDLSKEIGRRYAMAITTGEDLSKNSYVNNLKIRRARILKKAVKKNRNGEGNYPKRIQVGK